MMVLDTFMTILVIGILSSTIAQEQIPSQNQPINGAREGSDVPNSGASSIFGITAEDLERSMAEDCEENGGPTAYSTLVQGWQTSVNCTGPVVDLPEFEDDKTAALSNRKWDTFAKKYCRKVPTLLQCVGPFVESLKSCLDIDNREIFETYQNITSSFLEFICQNDGNRTTSFYTNGGKECMESKLSTLERDCPWETPGNRTRLANIQLPVWIGLGLKECAEIERLGTCTVAVMRTCENPTPADVVESIVQFYKTRKSCPTIPAAQAAPAT